MAGDTYLTLVGNLTADPKTGISKSGHAFAQLRLASTSRFQDRTTSEWRDGATIYLNMVCYRRLAENVGSSLRRGDRVMVAGRLKPNVYDDSQGVRHHEFELDIDSIGPELGRTAVRLLRPAATREPPAAPDTDARDAGVPDAPDIGVPDALGADAHAVLRADAPSAPAADAPVAALAGP